MIIEIKAVPEIPLLETIPRKVKERFIGLKMQARSSDVFLGWEDDLNNKISSRSLEVGKIFHFVPTVNVLGAVFENRKKTKDLYVYLSAVMTDEIYGIIFGPDDVKIVAL